jgi:hypothetical protein
MCRYAECHYRSYSNAERCDVLLSVIRASVVMLSVICGECCYAERRSAFTTAEIVLSQKTIGINGQDVKQKKLTRRYINNSLSGNWERIHNTLFPNLQTGQIS